MHYFLELINSYKRRGCCASLINEVILDKKSNDYSVYFTELGQLYPEFQKILNQQQGRGKAPSNNDIFVEEAPNRPGVLKVNIGGDKLLVFAGGLVTKTDGSMLKPSMAKRAHTKYFGEIGTAVQGQGDTLENDEEEAQQEQPQLTPEQLAAQQAEQEAKQSLLKFFRPLLSKVWDSAADNPNKNVLCKLQIGKAIAMSQRNLRGDRRTKGDTSQADIEVGDQAYDLFKQSKYCEALKLLENSKWGKRLLYDKKRYLGASLLTGQKLLINALSKIVASTAEQITTALFNIKCPQNVKRQDCVELKTQSLPKDSKDGDKARKKLLKVIQDLSSDRELSPDRLKEIRETIIFTRQGDMIIRIAPDKGIVVSDSDRLMFDALSKAMKDKGINNPIIYDLEKKPVAGDVISIRGKTFEHMFSILDFMERLEDAETEGDKEKVKEAYAEYLGSIDKLCTFLTAMEGLVSDYEDNQLSINESDLVEFNNIRDQITEAEGCLNLSKTFNATLGRAYARYKMMDADYSLQVGATVGDGTREDVAYLYNDEQKAREKAAMLGLEPVLTTLSEVMRNNKDYADAINFNPETDDREVWAVPDGLKMSAGNKACLGNGGRAKNITVLLADEKDLNQDQINWRMKTAEALGLSQRDLTVIKGPLREFNSTLEETDRLINGINVENNVIGKDGKPTRESGLVSVNNQMEERKKQLQGLDPISDPVYQNLSELSELMKAKPIDQAAIDTQKKAVIRAMQHEQTKTFVKNCFERNPNGSFKDPKKAKAAAMFLVMSGSTNKDMSTTVVGVGKSSRGSPADYIIPHNKALGNYLKRALAGDSSVDIDYAEDESKDFYTRVKTNDSKGRLCQVEFVVKPNGAISAMVNKGTIRDNAMVKPEGFEDTSEDLGESVGLSYKLLQLLKAQKEILMEFITK